MTLNNAMYFINNVSNVILISQSTSSTMLQMSFYYRNLFYQQIIKCPFNVVINLINIVLNIF